MGPVGFEPTTSAESLVYGYLHALLNFLIPQFWVGYPVVMDSGARRHSFLGPSAWMGLARLRPRVCNEGSMQRPTKRRVSEILGIKLSRNSWGGTRLFFFLGDVCSCLGHVPSCCFPETVPEVVECG